MPRVTVLNRSSSVGRAVPGVDLILNRPALKLRGRGKQPDGSRPAAVAFHAVTGGAMLFVNRLAGLERWGHRGSFRWKRREPTAERKKRRPPASTARQVGSELALGSTIEAWPAEIFDLGQEVGGLPSFVCVPWGTNVLCCWTIRSGNTRHTLNQESSQSRRGTEELCQLPMRESQAPSRGNRRQRSAFTLYQTDKTQGLRRKFDS